MSEQTKNLLGGNYKNSEFNNGGSYGYYWSATSISSSGAYSLGFSSSGESLVNMSTRGACMVKK